MLNAKCRVRSLSRITTQHSAPACLGHKTFSAQSTRAFEFVKDLVLEVFGFPTNPAEHLGPASSPVARAACKKRYLLDVRTSRTIQARAILLTTATLPADFIFISDTLARCNPWRTTFRAKSAGKLGNQHKHWAILNRHDFTTRLCCAASTPFPQPLHTLFPPRLSFSQPATA